MMSEENDTLEVLYPDEESPVPSPPATPAATPKPFHIETSPKVSTKGSWGRGALTALGATLSYLVIPLGMFYFIQELAFMVLQPGFELVILGTGVPIVIVAFVRGYAHENDRVQYGSQVIQTVLTALYLFGILGRGPLSLSIGAVMMTVELTGVFYLLLIATIVHGLSPAWDLVQSYRRH